MIVLKVNDFDLKTKDSERWPQTLPLSTSVTAKPLDAVRQFRSPTHDWTPLLSYPVIERAYLY